MIWSQADFITLPFQIKKNSNSQNFAPMGFEVLQLVRILTPNKSWT